MINVEPMNLTQVRQVGLEILSRELGPVGMVRFLQQFEMGQGNYTEERHQWLDELTVDEIANQIQKKRTKHST
ncbi:MAG: hypothetical protein ACYTFK_13570 [Planctomycetota bacterium]|jgi:hypothetical protein